MQVPDPVISRFDFIHYLANPHATEGNPINSCIFNPKDQLDPPVLHYGGCKDLPWEFFRPVTGIGSNSSSVPASALACWGSKSEIRRDESAEVTKDTWHIN